MKFDLTIVVPTERLDAKVILGESKNRRKEKKGDKKKKAQTTRTRRKEVENGRYDGRRISEKEGLLQKMTVKHYPAILK